MMRPPCRRNGSRRLPGLWCVAAAAASQVAVVVAVAVVSVASAQLVAERDTPVGVSPGVNAAMATGPENLSLLPTILAPFGVDLRLGAGLATPAPTTLGGAVLALQGGSNFTTILAGLDWAHSMAPRFDGLLMADSSSASATNGALWTSADHGGDQETLFLPNTVDKRDPFTCGLGASIGLGAAEEVQHYTGVSNTVGVTAWGDDARTEQTNLYLEAGALGQPLWPGVKDHRIVAPIFRGVNKLEFGVGTSEFLNLISRQLHWVVDQNDAPTITPDTYALPDVARGRTSIELRVSELLGRVNYRDLDRDMGYCVYSGIVVSEASALPGSRWQYFDDRANLWYDFPGVTETEMFHLPAEGQLRLQAGQELGANRLLFRAWDSTSFGSIRPQADSLKVYERINDVMGRLGGQGAGSLNEAALEVEQRDPGPTTGTTGTGGVGGGSSATGSATASSASSTDAAFAPASSPSQAGEDGDDDIDGSDDGLSFTWWVVGGFIVAFLLGAAVAVFLMSRKKGNDDDQDLPRSEDFSSSSSAAERIDMDSGTYHNVSEIQSHVAETPQYHNVSDLQRT